MNTIRTVLCPVDFTSLTDRALEIAVEICRRAGARLVLHHNLGPAPPDFLGVHWMWDEEHEDSDKHKETAVAEEFGKLFAELPEELEYEAKVTRGPLEEGLLFLAKSLPADLIVIGSHGAADPDHRSVTDQIILRAPCAVLATAEGFDPAVLGTGGLDPTETRPVLVATNLTPQDRGAVDFGFALAEEMPYELHLLHVLKPKRRMTEGIHAAAEREAREKLTSLVPDDLRERTHLHFRWGSPAEQILAVAAELDAVLILLGSRKHGLLYRTFTGLTSLEVLHGSRLPIWFLPAGGSSRHARRTRANSISGESGRPRNPVR